jgi:pilus assembly protein CpaC
VTPEVSEVDFSVGITLEGIAVPGFQTRRASTGVDLGDGQTFAIAGLLQEKVNTLVKKVPGLGDVPVLGALFSSSEFQRNETELVILVTPRLVKPLGTGPRPLPTDHYQEPNDAEFYLLGREESGRKHRHDAAPAVEAKSQTQAAAAAPAKSKE